ncbi:hypothetical protein L1987_04098 [Smallanthus sonchifolius]|uniref:Uncharacterized protein n=1 Tax=Smallanthus sonchifolius TaxID=185202 RepID=A0ACB9KCD4_9ASTR|nr:hypothetical protein L1987_04098 [Smallanthus sonchifolius]
MFLAGREREAGCDIADKKNIVSDRGGSWVANPLIRKSFLLPTSPKSVKKDCWRESLILTAWRGWCFVLIEPNKLMWIISKR